MVLFSKVSLAILGTKVMYRTLSSKLFKALYPFGEFIIKGCMDHKQTMRERRGKVPCFQRSTKCGEFELSGHEGNEKSFNE